MIPLGPAEHQRPKPVAGVLGLKGALPLGSFLHFDIAPLGLSLAFLGRGASALAVLPSLSTICTTSITSTTQPSMPYTQMHPPINTLCPFDRDVQIGIPGTRPCLTQRDVRSRDPVLW
jgi:hypothetical protein